MPIKLLIDRAGLAELAEAMSGEEIELSIIHHPPAEVVNLSAATYAVNEDGGSVSVTVNRTRPRDVDVDIGVLVEAITAIDGVHYIGPITGIDTVPIAVGATSAAYSIAVLDRDLGAGNSRTFRVSIQPSSTLAYLLGSTSSAVVTINGVGAVDDGGALQFTASSYQIPETAGTDTVTVQIARQGATGTPPAASVTVTSSNGTAVAPTDYTAVSTVVNWGSGDVANKNVPVTVVNNPAGQGDKSFTLTLSAPTGATLGAVSATSITIQDVISIPQVPWPLRGIYSIGSPQDYTSQAGREGIAINKMAIISYLPLRGIAQYQTDINALLALNPTLRTYLYRNWSQQPTGGASSWPVLIPHLEAGTGVPSLAQAPNQWFFQTPSGVQVTPPGGQRLIYHNSNCVADAGGLRACEYLADFMANVCSQIGIASVGQFWDDYRPYMLNAGNVVRNADNVARAYNEVTMQQLWRQGQIAGANRWRVVNATRRMMANTAVYATGQINGTAQPVGTIDADFKAINLDGGMFETPANAALWKFGRYVSGTSVLDSASGSFSQGLEWVRHGSHATSQFRMAHPDIVWTVFSMTDANLAGAGKTAGYQFARLCMGFCWVLTDHYLDMRPQGYGGPSQEYDEFYGQSVPGTFSGRMALRDWMGIPLEVSQGAPRSLGVYWREFTNALVGFNPENNGTQVITLPNPGAGKKWQRISGSQNPAVNDGTDTGATLSITENNGFILKRVPV